MNQVHDPLSLKDQKFGILDALFFNLMVGLGETYFVAYSLSLGHSEVQAGVLSTLPLMIGGVLQLFATKGIKKLNSCKKWVLVGASLQATVFLIIFINHLTGMTSYPVLFLLVSTYWTLQLGGNSAWNAWMSSIIPAESRVEYFSRRSLIAYVGIIIGLFTGGYLLHLGKIHSYLQFVFAVLFLIASSLRFISTYALSRQRAEFNLDYKLIKIPSIKSMKEFFSVNEYKYFLFFVLALKVGVYVSASFFSPYMLKEINLSYIQYMGVVTSGFVGKMLFMKFASTPVKKYSLRKLFLFSGLGIAFVPAFWMVSSNFYYLFIMEIFSGAFWGIFDLAFLLYVFDGVHRDRQVEFMVFYNFFHSLAIGLGVLIGGTIFKIFSGSNFQYFWVFGFSILCRFSFLPFYIGILDKNYSESRRSLIYRIIAIRPGIGGMVRPIWNIYKRKKEKN